MTDRVSDTPRTDRVARGRSEIASPTVVDVEFARTLEREIAKLRAEMIQMEREFQREARDIAAEERWKITQGGEYGSY